VHNGGRLAQGRPGADTWIKELFWREFYRHVLVHFPRVAMGRAFQEDTERMVWREDATALAAWQQGCTGYPIVDAAMRCLRGTGWMHNRLRMVTAQFLSKHLLLDWRAGERWFMQNLVDGDLASNNGGWQWSASTGTDAAPYFRVFHPQKQGERCDPQGEFVRRWVPELHGVADADIHAPPRLLRVQCRYPQPIVEHKTARERAIAAFQQLRQ
jgi:deoxyribodipyrimidine photo-lyase